MSEFTLRAKAMVLSNDMAQLHARLAAIEYQLEHGEYPQEWQIDVWAREFDEEHERAVEGLERALKADHEFKVMIDAFSKDEYEDPDEISMDEYCELCHDHPDGCDACRDS